jgi:hypothetical protein
VWGVRVARYKRLRHARFGQIETRNHFIVCLLKNLRTRATRQKLGVAGNVSDKIKHGLGRVWQ